jgi:hypothetical protein
MDDVLNWINYLNENVYQEENKGPLEELEEILEQMSESYERDDSDPQGYLLWSYAEKIREIIERARGFY